MLCLLLVRLHESDDRAKNNDHDDLNARIPTPPSSPTPRSSESSKPKEVIRIEPSEADKIAQEKFLDTLRAIGRRLQGQ